MEMVQDMYIVLVVDYRKSYTVCHSIVCWMPVCVFILHRNFAHFNNSAVLYEILRFLNVLFTLMSALYLVLCH